MKNYDLAKDGDSWKLKAQGADRASKVFNDMTKTEATRAAAEFAKKQPEAVSLKIHKENGRIQEERTYPGSADPKRSKG